MRWGLVGLVDVAAGAGGPAAGVSRKLSALTPESGLTGWCCCRINSSAAAGLFMVVRSEVVVVLVEEDIGSGTLLLLAWSTADVNM